MQKTAHIIGAGLSGLAAAIRLSNAGYSIHIHEATQQAGGRCPTRARAHASSLARACESPAAVAAGSHVRSTTVCRRPSPPAHVRALRTCPLMPFFVPFFATGSFLHSIR